MSIDFHVRVNNEVYKELKDWQKTFCERSVPSLVSRLLTNIVMPTYNITKGVLNGKTNKKDQ